jgi:hypothetical protein
MTTSGKKLLEITATIHAIGAIHVKITINSFSSSVNDSVNV